MTVVVATVAAGSLVACIWLTHTSEPTAFYLLPTRAWELALGGLLALAGQRLARLPRATAALMGWAGLAAIIWSVMAYDASTPFPGSAAIVPVLGAAALIAAGTASGGRARHGSTGLLGTKPMQSLGRVSYSWYLWHWPALVLGAVVWHSPLSRISMVALSLGLAYLTQRLVEEPFRHARLLMRRPRVSITAGIAVSAAAALIAVVAIQAAPQPVGHAPAVAAPRLLNVKPGVTSHSSAAQATPSRFAALDRLEQPLQAVLSTATRTQRNPVQPHPLAVQRPRRQARAVPGWLRSLVQCGHVTAMRVRRHRSQADDRGVRGFPCGAVVSGPRRVRQLQPLALREPDEGHLPAGAHPDPQSRPGP